jgi:hypothetical protein
MAEVMAVRRARSLERWLTRLIAAYQNPRTRPRRNFESVSELSSPTQAYGVIMPRGKCFIGAVLITHDRGIENGVVRALTINDAAALAKFASEADSTLGVGTVEPEYAFEGVLMQSFGLAERACMSLGERLTPQPLKLVPGEFKFDSRGSMLTLPPTGLWSVTFCPPLPDPLDILTSISSPKGVRRDVAAAGDPGPSAEAKPPPQAPQFGAFGGYPEPGLWFGAPPFPSSADRISKTPSVSHQYEVPVWSGAVRGTPVFTYNTGMSVVVTSDRVSANRLLNHFFGALDRSGVALYSIPDYEMIEINDVGDKGEVRGSRAILMPRNRLLRFDALADRSGTSFHLPVETVPSIWNVVEQTLAAEQATAALALFNAMTLFRRQHHTEAFVTAWSLVESVVGREFAQILAVRGWSKVRIEEMERDWKASQQIDLLAVVARLTPTQARQIHGLRKRRNKMMHELAGAAEADAVECLQMAASLLKLPSIHPPLKPLRVFL